MQFYDFLAKARRHDEIINTQQIVYITDSCSKIFLSREACVTLGIISSSFPTIGEATNGIDDGALCCCPQRELPPPLPEKLPSTATAANHGKLRNFLLEHYKSSTFNTCEHQLLPMMEGPPRRLIINPTAEPVAVHTPIPVPIHWREEVKAALDKDVRLGVIEQVPVGEPVAWCHRMVICPKKNGKPRRTGLPTIEHTCYSGNTSYTIAVSPSKICPTWQEEDGIRCMEWLS